MKATIFFNVALLALLSAPSKGQASLEELTTFLVKAKIETYASNDQSRLFKCEPGCKGAKYTVGDFQYRDRYFGEHNFRGEEIVWWKHTPIWGMNYFGVTDRTEEVPKEFPAFSMEAVRNVDKEMPFRGPKSYKKGEFEYLNNVEGTVRDFHGTEKILYRGREIYKLHYHGGDIVY